MAAALPRLPNKRTEMPLVSCRRVMTIVGLWLSTGTPSDCCFSDFECEGGGVTVFPVD